PGTGHQHRRHPGRGRDRQLPERRDLSRRSIGAGSGPQPRHLRRRPRAHRDPRGPAGDALRRRRPGRGDSLHHQQAEAGSCRGELLYQFDDDWNFLVSQAYQNLDAEGVFWQEAYDGVHNVLPELSVQLYNPSYNKDKFTDTAWTLNGKLGFLQAVYTGAYLDRTITQQQDYTNYARGTYA